MIKKEHFKAIIEQKLPLDTEKLAKIPIEKLRAGIHSGIFSSFQEGTIIISREEKFLATRFSRTDYMWLIGLLEGQVSEELEIAQSALRGIDWNNISPGEFYCVVYEDVPLVSVIGVGKVIRDSYWRINPGGFHIKVIPQVVSIQEDLIEPLVRNGDNVLHIMELLASSMPERVSLKGPITPVRLSLFVQETLT